MLKKFFSLIAISTLLAISVASGQGPLLPPGAPGQTMRSLTEIYDQAASAAQQAASARTPLRNPRILPIGVDSVITLNEPGSYYLAENVTGWAAKTGIKITTGSVTLDLNGFSLIGSAASASGVWITAGGNHIIKNGIIRNWGGKGISCAEVRAGMCTDIISASNGSYGFYLGSDYRAVRCTSTRNAQSGFYNPYPGAILEDCIASSNTTNGISLVGGVATNCIAKYNRQSGILAYSQTIVRSCNSYGNLVQGIYVIDDTCLVTDCMSSYNAQNGILVGAPFNKISNNVCVSNTSGILVTATNNIIEANTVQAGDYGIKADVGGNVIGRNVSRGNTTHFSIAPGNQVGPITNIDSATNPWGNISF